MATNCSIKRKKLVIVGDGNTGKTSILTVFRNAVFPKEPIPTIFESYIHEFRLGDDTIELELIDVAGTEEYDRLRPICYTQTHVVVICFSVVDPPSYDNVALKWSKEVRHFCPNVPLILVGNKTDLRNDAKMISGLARSNLGVPKTHLDGVSLAKSIKAKMYLECSALMQYGVQEIFHHATQAAIEQEAKSVRKLECNILQ